MLECVLEQMVSGIESNEVEFFILYLPCESYIDCFFSRESLVPVKSAIHHRRSLTLPRPAPTSFYIRGCGGATVSLLALEIIGPGSLRSSRSNAASWHSALLWLREV